MFRTKITNIKRLLLLILTFIVAAGIMTTSLSSAAVSAGKTGTSKVVVLGKGKDGKSYQNPHHSWGGQFKYTVRSGGTDYAAYCMQANKDFTSGKTYTVKNYKSSSVYKSLSSARQRTLALVLYYGYNRGKGAPYGNTNDYYAATQTMVWQATQGKIWVSAGGTWTNSTSGDYNLIKGHSYATKCYSKIKKDITEHLEGASFTKQSKSSAKTYTMKYNYKTKKWTTSITDTNKGNYLKKLAATTSGLSVSRSGYKYTFSASKAGTYTAAFANSVSSGTSQAMMVLQPSSSSNQAVILGASDETQFYVKLATQANGTAKIVKTSDNGVVKGFIFKLTNSVNGYSGSFTTDASGTISASLQPGTYKVVEQLTDAQRKAGYTKAPDQTVTIKAGATATVKVHNKYKKDKGGLKVNKETSDGGPLEGFSFKVEGIEADAKTLSKSDVLTQAAPTVSGLDDYEIGTWDVDAAAVEAINQAAKQGKTGAYPVTLTNKATLKQSATGPTNPTEPTDPSGPSDPVNPTEPTEPKPETVDLTISVNVLLGHVKDPAAGKTSKTTGNVTYQDCGWAGSATLFDKTIVTDITGTAEIDDMEFGTYTVTEIMTDLQKQRYHKPEPQTVVINEKNSDASVSVFYENKARTGDLKIKKTCVDGKIANVEMTITGKTAWGQEITPMVQLTDDKGYIDLGHLAAGTYTITESNLDTEIYVPQEPKTITITGDETAPVEVEFTNVPYTDIEISKQSETTGEELPGASLQVLDKETGKVVEEWTSAEETHIVKNLEYGKEYILHEDLAPLGYACAQDITFTAGGEEKITMVDEVSKLYITKIDKETKKYLPGASFEIKEKESGKVVANITTPKQENEGEDIVYTEVTGLIEGNKYIVHETKAPKGYVLEKKDLEITFVNHMTIAIANTAEGTVVIEGDDKINKATGAVQTGDDWSMLPYVLLSAAAAALAGFVWLRRKDKGEIYK